jgi:phosphatidylglycerol---prolipoprotein diacylglyceryl transferase
MYRHVFGIESYAVIQFVALILFAALAVVLMRRSNIRLRHAAALTVLYVLCNFLAAKLLFDLVKAPAGRHTLFDHPALAHFFEGGYWGWLLAFLPCVLAYPLAFRVPAASFYWVIAFLLPPVLSVQKVACFLAGCCFGCPTSAPWAVVFPDDSACELRGVPVHPLQVYDALLPLGILIVIALADRVGGKTTRPFLLPLMVGMYALTRFGTEFLRPNGENGALHLSQWIELGAALSVAVLLGVGRKPWCYLQHETESSFVPASNPDCDS